MSEAVIVCILSGAITLIGTIITVLSGNQKIQQDIKAHNQVQDVKLEELTREVRRHNDFAERIPRLETRLDTVEHQVEKLLDK